MSQERSASVCDRLCHGTDLCLLYGQLHFYSKYWLQVLEVCVRESVCYLIASPSATLPMVKSQDPLEK